MKITNIGVSILLANGMDTHTLDLEKVDQSILKTFSNYREQLKDAHLIESLEQYNCYIPIKFHLFGYFDHAYIYFQDSSEFNNKYLHPFNILNSSEDSALYDYKLITGYKAITDPTEVYKSITKSIKDNFVTITRLKLNTLITFGNGGALIKLVKQAIKRIKTKYFNKGQIDCYIIESFGYSELVLLSTSSDIINLTNFLIAVKELTLNQLEKLIDSSEDFEAIQESALSTLLALDSEDYNIFEKTSSVIGISDEKIINNDSLNFKSFWSINSGFLIEFYENLNKYETEINDSFSFGDKDYLTVDFYKNNKIDEVKSFLSENKLAIEDLVTRVGLNELENKKINYKLIPRTGKINRKAFNDYYKNLMLSPVEIANLVKNSIFIGLSNVLLQRVVSNVINFNKSISDPGNCSFFIESKDYLLNNLFNTISLVRNRLKNDPSYNKSFSIEKFETEIVLIIKGFESAYSNRYFHSHGLALHTDFNYSYKGGIQQYLIIYEFLFSNYCKRLYRNTSNNVSLYVSAYTITKSTPYWARMNIFHVQEPGLFLSIMAHESSIHIIDKIISKLYASRFDNNEEEFFDIIGKSKKEIITNLVKIGYANKGNHLLELFHLITSLEEREKIQKECLEGELTEFDRMTILYLMSDIISLDTTFKGNIDLFFWWTFVHFAQIIDVKIDRSENKEFLISILYRFELLSDLRNSLDKLQLFYEKFNIDPDILAQVKKRVTNRRKDNVKLSNYFSDIASTLSKFYQPTKNITCLDKEKKLISRKVLKNEDYQYSNEIIGCTSFLAYSYLEDIYKISKNNFRYKNEVNTADYEECMIIDPLGGLIYKGEKLRRNVNHIKTNFIKNIWHLSQLDKAKNLKNSNKIVI